jgi:hypothetical protein
MDGNRKEGKGFLSCLYAALFILQGHMGKNHFEA